MDKSLIIATVVFLLFVSGVFIYAEYKERADGAGSGMSFV